jgi:uncharacterized protein YggE
MTEENCVHHGHKFLAAVVIAGLFFIAGQYILSQPQRTEKEIAANREITVDGTGKVTAQPNIAQITVGVQTGTQSSATAAMNLLTQKFNAVVASVKSQGIKDEDINTTNFSVNPSYDYSNGQQTLKGFEATESITIKVRKLDSVGTVISQATSQGANQVGGINFTVDDPNALQLAAQQNAIKDAKSKAEQLTKTLGVGLGRVKSFNTTSNNVPRPFEMNSLSAPVAKDAGGAAPEVPVGSQDITSSVTITYELN